MRPAKSLPDQNQHNPPQAPGRSDYLNTASQRGALDSPQRLRGPSVLASPAPAVTDLSGVGRDRVKTERCGLQGTKGCSKWLKQKRELTVRRCKARGQHADGVAESLPHGSGPPQGRRASLFARSMYPTAYIPRFESGGRGGGTELLFPVSTQVTGLTAPDQ